MFAVAVLWKFGVSSEMVFLRNQYSFKWTYYLEIRVTRFEFEVEVVLNVAYCS